MNLEKFDQLLGQGCACAPLKPTLELKSRVSVLYAVMAHSMDGQSIFAHSGRTMDKYSAIFSLKRKHCIDCSFELLFSTRKHFALVERDAHPFVQTQLYKKWPRDIMSVIVPFPHNFCLGSAVNAVPRYTFLDTFSDSSQAA